MAAAEGSAAPRIPSDVFVEGVRVLIVATSTAAGQSVAGGAGGALGACGGYVLGGVVGRFLRRATYRFECAVERTPAVTLAAGTIGALALGAMGAMLGLAAVLLLPGRWGYAILGLAAWVGVYAGFQVGARKGVELLEGLGRQSLLGDPAGAGLVLVDSSAAMDDRFLALVRSGFMPGGLAVPRFVLDELHGLSDAADPVRRRRARRALEVLEAVRASGPGLVVLPDEVPDRDEVDDKLVALGARLGATVLTADRGLAGVAGAEGVAHLDLDRLGEAARSGAVPGEVVQVRLTREGRDPGQAVGFLDDGAMVVVNDAISRVGDDVDAEVVSSVPTSKGRLYFAVLSK